MRPVFSLLFLFSLATRMLGRWGATLALIWGGAHVIRSIKDLPKADGDGIITLPAGRAWFITTHIDLMGARLYCPGTTTIYGSGQEAASLRSTGLTGQPLLEANGTLALRYLAFSAPVGELMLDVDGDGDTACDWQYVNFSGGGRACSVLELNNFVGEGLGVLDTQGFVFEGAAQSIVFNNSLFSPPAGDAAASFEAGATINRRMRLTNCAIIAVPGSSGVEFNGPTVTNITVVDLNVITQVVS